jgi:hypothetical protein
LDISTIIVIALLFLLVALPFYGALRIGIAIGARRAIDNIVDGFISAGNDYSEFKGARENLKTAINNRDHRYSLFGLSKVDWYRNKKTKDIGNGLERLAFEAGQMYMRGPISITRADGTSRATPTP